MNPGASAPLFGARIKAVSPKFSKRRFVASNPTVGKRATPAKRAVRLRKPKPRLTPKRGGAIALAGGPRYSPKPSGIGKKSRVSPRYSPPRAGALALSQQPLYSAKPRRKKKSVVTPRYTEPKKGVFAPYDVRYTEVAKKGRKAKVSPLYSKASKRNYKVIKKPGFTLLDYLVAIPGSVILAVRPHNEQLAEYVGNLKRRDITQHNTKFRKFQGHARREMKIVRNFRAKRRAKSLVAYSGDFKRRTAFFEKLSSKRRSRQFSDVVVPSGYNKHRKDGQLSKVNPKMKKIDTRTGKEVDKKVGKLRSKLDGNKNQPPSVRGRSKKLKFDKKEKGLWYE